MTYKEARARQRREEAYYRSLKRIARDIEYLRVSIEFALKDQSERERQEKAAKYALLLPNDKAFVRTVARYHGNSEHGWLCACRVDGRLKRLVSEIGWGDLHKIIQAVRRSQHL